MTEHSQQPETATVELVFAVTRVTYCTKACLAHGDSATFNQLSKYYALVAEAVEPVDGKVIKALGDGVLLTFPINRCREAVEALRELQKQTSELWHRFEERCHVQVKVGAGSLVCGPLGPPGAERFDVVGDALNQLFKAPWSDFELAPEVLELIANS